MGQIIGEREVELSLEFWVLIPHSGVFIFKSSEAPGYPTGYFTNGAFQILGGLGVLLLRAIYVRRNCQIAGKEGIPKWRL